jgi:uncharacterized protein (TIGR00290 family)
MKAFVSWSGGKEASLSYYKAMQDQKTEIACLLNMSTENGQRSRTHGLSSKLLKLQAKAIDIPIVQKKTSWDNYEEGFKKTVSNLKKDGIEAGVFGDIDLQEHRDWVERVCEESNIKPIFPLWQKEREEIIREFIHSGFEAVVVATKADILDSKWIGRKIDQKFIKDLKNLNKIDLCGEAGEYHTFVTYGPIFKKRIDILNTKKTNKDKHWFLDILDYRSID